MKVRLTHDLRAAEQQYTATHWCTGAIATLKFRVAKFNKTFLQSDCAQK